MSIPYEIRRRDVRWLPDDGGDEVMYAKRRLEENGAWEITAARNALA
jgi:hypothetical protein